MIHQKLIDERFPSLRNVYVPQMLARDGAILAFHQGVVIAVPHGISLVR